MRLDAPVGNSDGVVRGERYFECAYAHGRMLPVGKLKLTTDSFFLLHGGAVDDDAVAVQGGKVARLAANGEEGARVDNEGGDEENASVHSYRPFEKVDRDALPTVRRRRGKSDVVGSACTFVYCSRHALTVYLRRTIVRAVPERRPRGVCYHGAIALRAHETKARSRSRHCALLRCVRLPWSCFLSALL